MSERPWRIEIRPGVFKSLRRLSRGERERILEAIMRLPAGDVLRLQGTEQMWRLRVGDWRVRFHRDDSAHLIAVLAVASRGSAYKP
ncbi:MAG: type II toxin-antitoxin system RelE family toxin [Candidatus Dormibacteraceae bacterium]